MKKFSFLLAIVMIVSLAACGTPTKDATTVTTEATTVTTEATTVLEISDLSYSESGAIEDFQIAGIVRSSSDLVRIEMNGLMESQEMGISVSDDAEPFYFEDGVTSADLSVAKEYLVNQMSELYALYVAITADMEGAMTAQLNCTCYDAAGDSVNFTVKYDIVTE